MIRSIQNLQMRQSCPDEDVVVDGVNHAGKNGRHGDHHDDRSTPIDALPVPVNAAGVVELGDVNFAALDEPVIADHNARHRRQEDDIGGHEVEECDGRRQNLPRCKSPSSEGRGQDRSSPDVEIFGEQRDKVVRGANGVSGEIDCQHGK